MYLPQPPERPLFRIIRSLKRIVEGKFIGSILPIRNVHASLLGQLVLMRIPMKSMLFPLQRYTLTNPRGEFLMRRLRRRAVILGSPGR